MIKSLNIKGTKYKIKFVECKDNYVGLCDKNSKEIHIKRGLPAKETFEVLLHEVCHAIFHECSIYQAVDYGVEEIIVDNIASEFVKHFIDVEAFEKELKKAK